MKTRLLAIMILIGGILLVAGYRLNQANSEVVTAAEPVVAPVKVSLNTQATTVEDIKAPEVQAEAEPVILFEHHSFGYQLSYPASWNKTEVSANVVTFQSPDHKTQVTVEAVGPLPADGLTPFVDRSVADSQVFSRQSLTIHSFPAERVVTSSDQTTGQMTTFFIDAGQSAYVIAGAGEQHTIEMIARSFNVSLTSPGD